MQDATHARAITRAEARDQLLQLVAECGPIGSSAVDVADIEWLLLAWFAKGVLTLGDVAELGNQLAKADGHPRGAARLRAVSYRLH